MTFCICNVHLPVTTKDITIDEYHHFCASILFKVSDRKVNKICFSYNSCIAYLAFIQQQEKFSCLLFRFLLKIEHHPPALIWQMVTKDALPQVAL